MSRPTGAISTGDVTNSTAIMARAGWYYGMQVISDGANDKEAILYDSASEAAGTVIARGYARVADVVCDFVPGAPLWCANGLYLSLADTDGYVIVHYRPE